MFKNPMLNNLIGLQKQGIEIHMTDEGWKTFFIMMRNEEVVIETEARESEESRLVI